MTNTTLTDDLIAEIERVDDMDGIHMIAHSDMKAIIAELRSLRELVGPIEGKGKTIHHEGRMYYPAEMVNSLIAKNRSLRADAERYRWLIEQPWFQSAFDRYDIDDGGLQSIFERECAHVIDTAMQASK